MGELGRRRRETLSEVLGARKGSIRYGRAALFFIALAISDAAFMISFSRPHYLVAGIPLPEIYPSSLLIALATDLALTVVASCFLAFVSGEKYEERASTQALATIGAFLALV